MSFVMTRSVVRSSYKATFFLLVGCVGKLFVVLTSLGMIWCVFFFARMRLVVEKAEKAGGVGGGVGGM